MDDVEKNSNTGALTRARRLLSEGEFNKSAVTDHVNSVNHVIDWNQTKVLDSENNWLKRGIKEAIFIRKNRRNMNRDEGRFQLSHAYDSLLTPPLGGRVHVQARRHLTSFPASSFCDHARL